MQTYRVLGMMSGTSLDGLDLAYCHFWQKDGVWDFEIRQCATISYDNPLYKRLKNAIHLKQEEHSKLHEQYGTWLGLQAHKFIEQHQLEIDFIASHGHTSHHRPSEGLTFQLGHGQALANASEKKVICDFRTLDVRLGGQGAPLVPIGDSLLLGNYDFCLNLGGISNMSFQKKGKRYAYDIGMANMPLNHLTEKIGLAFDEGGKLASKGKLIEELLAKLNALPYYQMAYPKSTGYEWFSTQVQPLIVNSSASTKDLLHTLIHHNCEQIANAIRAEQPKKGSRLLVTGGGALNDFFMQTLEQKLKGICALSVPPKKFIEYKEALVFAFMGVLRELDIPNVLSSVTGAKKDSCSGVVYQPKNS